jgi:hypothetical protein
MIRWRTLALINVISIIVLVGTSIGVFDVGKTSFVKGNAAGRTP